LHGGEGGGEGGTSPQALPASIQEHGSFTDTSKCPFLSKYKDVIAEQEGTEEHPITHSILNLRNCRFSTKTIAR
jgi:hypothetical protein